MSRFAPLALIFCLACELPPPASLSFSEATSYAFLQFDTDNKAELASALRDLERELYLAVDIDTATSRDRGLTPGPLSDGDLDAIEHPDRPAENLRAITLIKPSLHASADHRGYILLDDQVPVEPASPNHYDRSFESDTACWEGRTCDFLRTENELTKENFLIGEVPYTLYKDYRWVDLGLPHPQDVPEGEEATNPGDPRWALIARSWTTESAYNETGDKAIHQSYSVEVWIPRDGNGYIRSDEDENGEDGDGEVGTWTQDSDGEGVLRMLTLWTENDLGGDIDEEVEVNTIRGGIEGIFDAQEEWMDEH